MSPTSRPLRRRTLLGAGLAAVASPALGCSPSPPGPDPRGPVARLVAGDPFYVAHRGGGGDWPELTAYAYSQAARVPGLTALEISVCLCSDGVLVSSHDPTTARLTGVDYTIADQTWATLSRLEVSAAETRDPSQPSRPFTRFDDVVEAYLGDFVLFVEPKVSPAVRPLLDRMVALGRPERVVWKQPVNSSTFATAKQQGFSTWGYVLNEPGHLGTHLEGYAASADIDLLGAPRAESDAFISAVVRAADANAKPTISWAVRSPADRDRVRALGCRGMMTSNLVEVLGPPR